MERERREAETSRGIVEKPKGANRHATPNSGRIQGLRQPDQIQRRRPDHAAARALDVGLRHFWILSAATYPRRRAHRKVYQSFITRRERVWRQCLTAVRGG